MHEHLSTMLLEQYLIFVIFTMVDCATNNANGCWHYESGKYGPHDWEKYYEDCRSDNNQSPVNIDTDATIEPKVQSRLIFHNYNISFKNLPLKNTFRTVPDAVKPQIEGGGLVEKYQLSEVHFHWGSTDSEGSEHTIDNLASPCEVHLVHTRIHMINGDTCNTNKVAVLASLCKVTTSVNEDLSDFINATERIISGDKSSDQITSIQPTGFLPKYKQTSFYRYEGSLTTPPCTTSVIWTVFEKPLRISKLQLSILRRVPLNGGLPKSESTKNYRPIQPLNGRQIFKYGD